MSSRYRRYEFLLPQRFNDGRAVPDDLYAETILELREKFGAVSSESQTIYGVWEHGKHVYRDELIRVFVDVPDALETEEFFREFKERLKARFEQIDIWMTAYPVEVI